MKKTNKYYSSLSEDELFNLPEEHIARYFTNLYDTMPSFYKDYLSATLQQAVESQLNTAVEDQLNLFEELAIIRKFACQSLDLFRIAEEDKDSKPTDRIYASRQVERSLQLVTEFCEKAAKVDSMQRDKYSIHTINSVVAQIVNIIYIVLEMDAGRRDLAVTVEEAIRNRLKVPVQTVKLIDITKQEQQNIIGTNLTPDKVNADVLSMDSSIPNVPNITPTNVPS